MIQRACSNHADREAIGRCVMTGKSICAECSTRYEGVNYSKEGLRILQQRRLDASRGGSGVMARVAIWASSPFLIFMLYIGFDMTFRGIIDLIQVMR